MRKGRWVGSVVAAVVVLTGCGGTTVEGATPSPAAPSARTPTPRATTPTATPTEERVFADGPPPVAYRTQEGAALVQVRRYSWQRTASGDEAAPPSTAYLVLEVVVTATEGRVQVNPLYFTARTPQGTESQPVLGADGNEPVLASRELNAGESVGGIVTFDTPKTDTVIAIVDELGNRAAEIQIPAA